MAKQKPMPSQAWVYDVARIRSADGWCYLAAVIDLCSREVLGWSSAADFSVSLLDSALGLALQPAWVDSVCRPEQAPHSQRTLANACYQWTAHLHEQFADGSARRVDAGACTRESVCEELRWRANCRQAAGLPIGHPVARLHPHSLRGGHFPSNQVGALERSLCA